MVYVFEGLLGGIINLYMYLMYLDRVLDGIGWLLEWMFVRYNLEWLEDGGCCKDSGGRLLMVFCD